MSGRPRALLVLFALVLLGAGASPGERRLDRYGISVAVPRSWHAHLYFRSSLNGFVLQASTVPITSTGDDLSSATQRRLASKDVLIVLFEYGPNRDGRYTGVANLPARSQPLDPPPLSKASFEGQAAPGQAMEAFETAGRFFQLFVFYGRRHPSPADLAAARRVVRSIRITPLSFATRARLLAVATHLLLVRDHGAPSRFRQFAAIPEIGSFWWRCVSLGPKGKVAAAFVASPMSATDGVSVRVTTIADDERRARVTVQPGESIATPVLRAFHFTWRVTQVTEPRTVRVRVEMDAPARNANTCFIPALNVWQRTLPHS